MNQLEHLDTLARTLYGEARGEPDEGVIAVAQVILNRANKPKWWGRDIKSVCQKAWQFSCWNKADPNREKLIALTEKSPQFLRCLHIGAGVMAGLYADLVQGATHYHADGWAPDWAEGKTPCVTIGRHHFYNNVE